MDTERIIRKIKACLALSGSPEPHEAAAALRQAEALMREHKIDIASVQAAGAAEHLGKMGFKREPPTYAVLLANLVAKAFQCDAIIMPGRVLEATKSMEQYYPSLVAFIGVGALPALAHYTYEVLLRALQGARRRYVRTLDTRCKAPTRARRSEAFTHGWLSAVWRVVEAFAGRDAEADQAVLAYRAVHYPNTASRRMAPARVRNGDLSAAGAGYAAGQAVQLHRGVESGEAPRALGVG